MAEWVRLMGEEVMAEWVRLTGEEVMAEVLSQRKAVKLLCDYNLFYNSRS